MLRNSLGGHEKNMKTYVRIVDVTAEMESEQLPTI
jgi:hypothetical protein